MAESSPSISTGVATLVAIQDQAKVVGRNVHTLYHLHINVDHEIILGWRGGGGEIQLLCGLCHFSWCNLYRCTCFQCLNFVVHIICFSPSRRSAATLVARKGRRAVYE